MTIEVIKPGLLTTLQDAGRPGHAHLGVGRSGAFDAPALHIANALCGNSDDACALEITLLGPTLHFRDAGWIAVTGAPMPIAVDGVDAPMWTPVHVRAGATLKFGAMRSGCRGYFAVAGAIDVEPVLGSCSSDVNAQLGPFGGHPLHAGQVLAVGQSCANVPPAPNADRHPKWQLDPRPWFDGDPRRPLRLLPGSHLERLTESARKKLFFHRFTVQPDSNRTGVRLVGPTLEWIQPIEMVSEGCVPGLLQLPPSGQPIAFGPECPVSGGYPRIGQIAAVDLPRLAQRRPGDAVRFRPCTLEEALHALDKREHALEKLDAAMRTRLKMDSGFRRDETAPAPE